MILRGKLTEKVRGRSKKKVTGENFKGGSFGSAGTWGIALTKRQQSKRGGQKKPGEIAGGKRKNG